jgi:hypothetical protein
MSMDLCYVSAFSSTRHYERCSNHSADTHRPLDRNLEKIIGHDIITKQIDETSGKHVFGTQEKNFRT